MMTYTSGKHPGRTAPPAAPSSPPIQQNQRPQLAQGFKVSVSSFWRRID